MKVTESAQIHRDRLFFEELACLEYRVVFRINNQCNFTCEYCNQRKNSPAADTPDVGTYSPQHIAKCFDGTGRTWAIALTGGETFLYPRFTELAQALTERHCIGVFTNLSTRNVYEFADLIPPERVLFIRAACHMVEREKRPDGVRDYVEKILHFQSRGFNIRVVYVLYPSLLSRVARDIDYFRSHGVRNIILQTFAGEYGGKRYPESYTSEQKSLIDGVALGKCEVEWEVLTTDTFGRLCSAGQKSFRMAPDGSLTRCVSVPKAHGNLLTGEYHFDKSPMPCPVNKCFCLLGDLDNREPSAFWVLKTKMPRVARFLDAVASKCRIG
jgi:MoaA/NifB/PqqE/SkfB family radical SAM enzyme